MQASLRLVAALALSLLSTAAAWAQARIEDCEKIEAADAYNQCLAKFGPTSKVKSVEPLKPGDIKDSSAEAAAGAAAKGGAPGPAASGHGPHGHIAHGQAAHGHAARGRSRQAASRAPKHAAKAPGRKRMVIIVKHR